MRPSTVFRPIVAVGLTLWALWAADPRQVGDAFVRTSWPWVAAACLLVLADRALMAQRWLALCAPIGRRPPRSELLRIFFVSTFLGTFLVQSVGSDAVRTWSLARAGAPASQALASVLLDRLLGVVSILLGAAAGAALAPYVLREAAVAWAFAAAAGGSAFALLFVFSTRVDDLVRRSLSRLPAGRVRDQIGRLLDALQAYRTAHRLLGGVLAASIGVQILRIVQAWLLGRALGIDAPVTSYFAFIPIILLVMLLPITVSGLGVSQWAFVWTFAQVGVSDASAFALSILFVALGVVGNLPGGILYALGRPVLRDGPGLEAGNGPQARCPLPLPVPVTPTVERALSVIIPAYNESANILATLENVAKAFETLNLRHEILVIDDGSRDRTAAIVEEARVRYPAVRLLRNEKNMGFGWSYRRGVDEAALAHIVMVHGDNAWGWATLREFFGRTGEADVIIGFTRDMLKSRTWTRTVISKTFTLLVNLITWRRLRYYNGLQIHRAPILKSLHIESRGYGFQAEVLVKAMRLTRTYVEVPMDLIEREQGESKAFRIRNFVDVFHTLRRLVVLEWGRHD